ncbi:MAG: hypothetical protein J7647_32050 [Cyanobacteria bacterium SBLK]|nr:hypothetical protein [Cyanobacteria bacterium SBLK]
MKKQSSTAFAKGAITGALTALVVELTLPNTNLLPLTLVTVSVGGIGALVALPDTKKLRDRYSQDLNPEELAIALQVLNDIEDA